MWHDGDVKRHYFSSKLTYNKWLKEFISELMSDPTFPSFYGNLKDKSKKDIMNYFSSALYLTRIELDEA
jgi:hypothetical protein